MREKKSVKISLKKFRSCSGPSFLLKTYDILMVLIQTLFCMNNLLIKI